MSRRKRHRHEEHTNHESWAIPYGDLVTLLLAFFVVMYAISSVNAGKYRVLSDSLVAAFRGTAMTTDPKQIGDHTAQSNDNLHSSIVNQLAMQGKSRSLIEAKPIIDAPNPQALALRRMAEEIESAMGSLIDANLVVVRRHDTWVEVEIKTDILFPSGVAKMSPEAGPVFALLARALQPFPNQIRVEGYTDDRPIKTAAFQSNWELSAGRAASVVHLLMQQGMDPRRLSVTAYGEFRPRQPNDSVEGRNSNRRVVMVIVSDAVDASPEQLSSAGVSPTTQAVSLP